MILWKIRKEGVVLVTRMRKTNKHTEGEQKNVIWGNGAAEKPRGFACGSNEVSKHCRVQLAAQLWTTAAGMEGKKLLRRGLFLNYDDSSFRKKKGQWRKH